MNLQLALPLQRPPEQMLIVQPFGDNPDVYAKFGMQGHNGIDFAAEPGELVVAVDEGEVVEVRLDPDGYGLTVKLSHPWGESRYAHGQWLSVPIEFALGHTVRRGERIFLAGVSGGPDDAHVHFGLRIRKDDGSLDRGNANSFGGYEDPLPYLRQAPRAQLAPAPSAGRPASATKGKKSAA